MLLEQRAPQPFDEASRPDVAPLRLCMPNPPRAAGVGEAPFRLASVVGEHLPEPPARPAAQRPPDAPDEGRTGLRREDQQDPGRPAGHHLPHLPPIFRFPQVERINAHERARLRGGRQETASPAPRRPGSSLSPPLERSPDGGRNRARAHGRSPFSSRRSVPTRPRRSAASWQRARGWMDRRRPVTREDHRTWRHSEGKGVGPAVSAPT